MDIRAILIISSILFSCGCLGLLTVRLTNPFFKGLGWLGGAFAAGALGAILFAARPALSINDSVILPHTLILLAYVFLHVCMLELTESPSLVPRLGISLLVVQAVAYLVFVHFGNVEQLCIITLGLLLAIQTLQSAILLKKAARGGMLAPVGFTITLLVGFATYNIFRSTVVLVLGTAQNVQTPNPLEMITAFVFLGTGLGLGFGVFWMTSAYIRLALEGQANTDSLTGICNRRNFRLHCERELLRTSRTDEQFSLILFDLDHFKQVNDFYGHSTGDRVLCAVVEKLRNAVRNIDVVGRWGGEEFVALLPGANERTALIVAERLRSSVESLAIANFQPRDTPKRDIRITVSIGVATCIGAGDSIDDLLQRADTAMYQAKADGRNRVISADAQYALF